MLHLVGSAPFADWQRLRAANPPIPGVERIDASRLNYPDAVEIGATVARIEKARIGFAAGVEPDPAAESTLQAMLADLDRLERLAARSGIAVELHVFGLTDEPGGSLMNRDLRLRRAEWLALRLTPTLEASGRARADLETLSALEFHGSARAALVRIDLQPTRPATP
ncbi:hypothetical protein [Luteibacter sp. Lutesp34]|uniref:hypothetical protein n=1 Tax=Luteibacter sp. Lutesp34 TaxID=3243030 RepID=UPI0039B490D7